MPDETKTTAAPANAPADEGKTPEAPAAKPADAETAKAPEATKTETPKNDETPKVEETPVGPTEEELAAVAKEEEEIAKRKGKIVGAEELKPGMTVRVHERIKDISPKGEERERVQVFQGIILGMRNAGVSRTMTVRRISKGFGVEKIYPLRSPNIVKVEVVKIAKVHRAKLSFLNNVKRRFRRKLKETWIEQ